MSKDLNGHFGVCLSQVTAIHTIFMLVIFLGPFSGISGVFLAHLGTLESCQCREHWGDLKKGRGVQLSKPEEKGAETTLGRNTEVSVKR